MAQGVARVCMGAMGTFGCSAAGTARLSAISSSIDLLLYRLPYQLFDQLSYLWDSAILSAILGQATIRRAVFKAVSGEAGATS